ncbi:MAG: LuxR C-terminal-related transcriptional regulator [Frankia sp.]
MTADLTTFRDGTFGRYGSGRLRPSTTSGVRLLTQPEEIGSTIRALHQQTRAEVSFMAPGRKSPGVVESDIVSPPMLQRAARPALPGGITLRGVWPAEQFECAPASSRLHALAAHGSVRVSHAVPMRTIVWDRSAAVLPRDPSAVGRGALLVREPSLVLSVIGLIERHWSQAAAWTGKNSPRMLTTRHRSVLGLLAAGHTHNAIARRLNMAPRSVRRDVVELQEALGVAGLGPVALGAEAVRRGLLP